MDPLSIFLTGVLAPAVAAGVVLVLGWQLWRADATDRDGRWSSAPALGLAFLVGFGFLSGWPASFLPGAERLPTGLDWLAWCTVLGVVLLPFEWRMGRARWALRLGFASLLIRLVLRNAFTSTWEPGEGWAWFAGLVGLYLALWFGLDGLLRRQRGSAGSLLLWILATALAVLAALSGSAKIGQLGGALAAGLGAAIVLGWRRPHLRLDGSAVALVLLLLFGLGLNAHFFSYTTGLDILLLASAPFVALLGGTRFLRRDRAWQQALLDATLLLLPVGVALVRATIACLETADDYGY